MALTSLNITLERFEGPLGLLLHLIREQEMNIFDIDIAKITQQYLDYIKTMRSLDLEVAGDFVAMAATLLQIKSRMLLPQYNDEGEVIEKEDPRKELVQRLLEYQKYQEAAKQLVERPWVGRDVWLRGERLNIEEAPNDEVILEDNPLFSLISAYRTVVRSMKKGVHKVVGAMQSIAARILEMKELLVVGTRVEFKQLVLVQGEQRSNQILVTFLSLLELAKMGFVSLFQSETYGDIWIDTKKNIDRDVVSQVENYDNVNSAQAAEQILAESVSETPAVLGVSSTPTEGDDNVTGATDDEILAEEMRLEGMDFVPSAADADGALAAVEALLSTEPASVPSVESDFTGIDDLNLMEVPENGPESPEGSPT